MTFLILVNPFSAGGKALAALPRVREVLDRAGHRFQWKITNCVTDMESSIVSAADSGVDGVLLVGGDGTLSHALPALLKADLSVGIIPCGRGNDFARNLGLPLDAAKAAHFTDRPEICRIDIATANEKPFGSVACLGFDAYVSELARMPHKIFRGRAIFVYSVLKALGSFNPFEINMTIDNMAWKGPIMMVALANGSCYGGGMNIAPKADMTDGLLNICIIRKTKKSTLLKEFPNVFNGKHIDHPDVVMLTGQSVRVTSLSEQAVFADGEPVTRLPLTCTVGKHYLKVIQPCMKMLKGGNHAK